MFGMLVHSVVATCMQDGKLKPTLKSEPVPDAATNAAADVTVVVGESFADIALDGSKDVLLEIYAPCEWHCSISSIKEW